VDGEMKIIVGITGASGAAYGVKALELLGRSGVETHVIVSDTAEVTLKYETGLTREEVEALADRHYRPEELWAPVASGSYDMDGMLIAPCSIKTLSAVANSYADTILVRAADVILKEGKPLVLMVRETPLHRGHIRLMDLAAQTGAVIFPPSPAMYGKPQTVEDVVESTVGRMIARLGVGTEEFPHWRGIDQE
jgi:4-hydroxy-3-polyprenylbenzoate decarboxylase